MVSPDMVSPDMVSLDMVSLDMVSLDMVSLYNKTIMLEGAGPGSPKFKIQSINVCKIGRYITRKIS